jgi:hypothetical protein
MTILEVAAVTATVPPWVGVMKLVALSTYGTLAWSPADPILTRSAPEPLPKTRSEMFS